MGRCITSQQSSRKRRASFIKKDERSNPRSQKISEDNRRHEDREEEMITRTINDIARGFARGSTTKLTSKKHLQEVLSLSTAKIEKAYKASPTPKIMFSSSDLGIVPSHDDPWSFRLEWLMPMLSGFSSIKEVLPILFSEMILINSD